MRWGGGSTSGTQHAQEPAAFREVGELLVQEQASPDAAKSSLRDWGDHRETRGQAEGHHHPCTVTMRERSSRPSFHSSSTETSSLFPAQSQPCPSAQAHHLTPTLCSPVPSALQPLLGKGWGLTAAAGPDLTAHTRCPLVLALHC